MSLTLELHRMTRYPHRSAQKKKKEEKEELKGQMINTHGDRLVCTAKKKKERGNDAFVDHKGLMSCHCDRCI